MPNKYIYNYTFEDKHMEEDRECLNDFYRSQTDYYSTLTDINLIILKALETMSTDEIRDKLICPVLRLK